MTTEGKRETSQARNAASIEASPDMFSNFYSSYKDDMERTENLSKRFGNSKREELLGTRAEMLVCHALAQGTLGKILSVRHTNSYDDYFHGVDAVITPKAGDVPAVGTIDVTMYQDFTNDMKGGLRRDTEASKARPEGLEKKLLRIKSYADKLASYGATFARELVGWMQSGGLSSPRTEQNKEFYNEAESVMLVKYYVTPETSSEPSKPGYIIGGPQAVLSVDTTFINRALQGNIDAQNMVQAIAFLEFAFGVHMLHDYLDRLVQDKQHKNLLFDTHYASVNAWIHILNSTDCTNIIKEFSAKYGNNREFRDQLSGYRKTLEKVFQFK